MVDDWDSGESGTKGTPYMLCKCKIVEPDEHKNRGINCFFYLTENAIWRLKKFVAAAGIDPKSLGKTDTTSPEFTKILNACKGRRMFWLVGEGVDDKGVPKNEINDFVNDLDQGPVEMGDVTPKINWNE